ncbi:MAG: PleD family two-component system response regulator [Bacteroidota bacterium]
MERTRILLVDDEIDIIDVLSYNFRKKGFDTFHAYDGITGLQKAILYQPHLIISDIYMPGMNGIRMCLKLKENNAVKHIPIIFLSASTDELLSLSTLGAGAERYLSKPVRLPLLYEVVGQTLEKYS